MTDVHTTLLEAHAWNGRTNDRGIAIIKFCEGWPKSGKPYVCPAGYWTQGYGILRGLNGKRVTKNTPPVDKQQGQTLLKRDLSIAEKAVHAFVGPRLTPTNSAHVLVSYSISGVVIFAPAKFVNGSYVRTTKELQTSGGSGAGVDRQSEYCQDWLDAERWRGSFLRRIEE